MANLKEFAKCCAISMLSVYAWVRIKLNRSPTLLIFTYHRVLPVRHGEREKEQPGMVVSPDLLKRHIQYAKKMGAVPIHLDSWIERKKNKANDLPALSVAFTFDDGWQDNYRYAYPVLQDEQVPATIFLVTGMIDTCETFWPERVLKLLCRQGTDLSDPALAWMEPYLNDLTRNNSGNALSLNDADIVINRLKTLDDATIVRHLDDSKKRGEIQSHDCQKRAILSTTELSEMARDDLVRYGAHTRSHFRLNHLKNEKELRDQIVGCLEDFQKMPVTSIPVFCYPNGDMSLTSENLVSNYYSAACTTRTGWNKMEQSEYMLNRINLHDGNSHSESALLATIGRGLIPLKGFRQSKA